MKKRLPFLVIFCLLLTGCSSSNEDKHFEIEKEIYLKCLDDFQKNYVNNPRAPQIGLLGLINEAKIYCVDFFPNALR